MVKLAFLCAFVVPKGTSLQEITGESSHESNVKDSFLPARNARRKGYHDLNDIMAMDYEFKLKLQSVASSAKATSAARLVILSVYLRCKDDGGVPVSLQEIIIAEAQTSGRVINGERVFCGHNSFFKSPGCTAGFSRRAAGEEFDTSETWISPVLKLAQYPGKLTILRFKKTIIQRLKK